MARSSFSTRRRRPILRPILIVAATILVIGSAVAWAAGFFDSDPDHFFGSAAKGPVPVAALYMSGDMGLRFGMGSGVSHALAIRRIPVLGISSPALFAIHRTPVEVDAIVARGVRDVVARTGAERVILIGQSFGADVLGTGAAALPSDLRRRIAAIVLVVPGQGVFYRADPTGFAYRGTPDADPVAAAKSIGWAPYVCIYGEQETDSLCPRLKGTSARVIALPGGHFLHRDEPRLIATIIASLRPHVPQLNLKEVTQ
ncbi:AcvB/VirJ family lysyl-phosphatidylglycerol hydrolase [Sphingomonas alpina]|uniref:Type IV secretion system protein VirJ n=1 Tax=Sphingomonas alpina TaxID=653931 RepID=A0A7H0LDG5_9SPHN|nr:AcvB/VirJ family lysyl-phosphatidylglycerol hydrolase [Sphingomonas alpina]QNQ07718.1 type IV secretion system protein VirJ [Sphingomonas alpina]